MHLPSLNNDKIPQSIVSTMRHRGIDVPELDGISSMSVLEEHIFDLVKNYNKTSTERQSVFHLVQIWGGNMGRMIYVRGDGFDWNKIDKHYEALIESCFSVNGHADNDFKIVFKAAVEFKKNVKYIGYSFITKHLRFWGYKNLEEWTFPPYDTVMACKYMKQCYDYRDIIFYWKRIYGEAIEKNISVSEYERYLFNRLQGEKQIVVSNS